MLNNHAIYTSKFSKCTKLFVYQKLSTLIYLQLLQSTVSTKIVSRHIRAAGIFFRQEDFRRIFAHCKLVSDPYDSRESDKRQSN